MNLLRETFIEGRDAEESLSWETGFNQIATRLSVVRPFYQIHLFRPIAQLDYSSGPKQVTQCFGLVLWLVIK